jgi:hypothetical protein
MLKAFIFGLLLQISVCNHQITEANCELKGQVKDYSHIDGCKLLIELENGDMIFAMKVPDGFELRADQKIRLSYKVVPNIASICMVETVFAEITCIRLEN